MKLKRHSSYNRCGITLVTDLRCKISCSIPYQMNCYLSALVLQVQNGSALGVVQRRASVHGAQEESQDQHPRYRLQSQTPTQFSRIKISGSNLLANGMYKMFSHHIIGGLKSIALNFSARQEYLLSYDWEQNICGWRIPLPEES